MPRWCGRRGTTPSSSSGCSTPASAPASSLACERADLVAAVARGFGCSARRVETYEDLTRVLDEVVPGLVHRDEPLLLDVVVAPDETFQP